MRNTRGKTALMTTIHLILAQIQCFILPKLNFSFYPNLKLYSNLMFVIPKLDFLFFVPFLKIYLFSSNLIFKLQDWKCHTILDRLPFLQPPSTRLQVSSSHNGVVSSFWLQPTFQGIYTRYFENDTLTNFNQHWPLLTCFP